MTDQTDPQRFDDEPRLPAEIERLAEVSANMRALIELCDRAPSSDTSAFYEQGEERADEGEPGYLRWRCSCCGVEARRYDDGRETCDDHVDGCPVDRLDSAVAKVEVLRLQVRALEAKIERRRAELEGQVH